ncbi:MAG: CvpA family protein [Methylophilus sp.]|nr:CvpA family protein [Methylophilus sp.]MDP3607903.1 CvpA family protein [Methylophilus sp.]
MTVFDYTVLVIVGISVLISLMRGAVREVLSLLGWVIAFYVARTYSSLVVPLLPYDIPSEKLKMLAAFVILFLAVLLVTSLIAIALATLLKDIGLGWLNRLLGGLFGLMRGLLVVVVLMLLAGMTQLPKDERWTNAMFSAPLEALVRTVLIWLPKSISQHVSFD